MHENLDQIAHDTKTKLKKIVEHTDEAFVCCIKQIAEITWITYQSLLIGLSKKNVT